MSLTQSGATLDVWLAKAGRRGAPGGAGSKERPRSEGEVLLSQHSHGPVPCLDCPQLSQQLGQAGCQPWEPELTLVPDAQGNQTSTIQCLCCFPSKTQLSILGSTQDFSWGCYLGRPFIRQPFGYRVILKGYREVNQYVACAYTQDLNANYLLKYFCTFLLFWNACMKMESDLLKILAIWIIDGF